MPRPRSRVPRWRAPRSAPPGTGCVPPGSRRSSRRGCRGRRAPAPGRGVGASAPGIASASADRRRPSRRWPRSARSARALPRRTAPTQSHHGRSPSGAPPGCCRVLLSPCQLRPDPGECGRQLEDEAQEPGRMSPLDGRVSPDASSCSTAVFADGLQHPEAWLALRVLSHEAVVDQAIQLVQQVAGQVPVRRRARLRHPRGPIRQRRPTRDGTAAAQLIEQVVAPVDGTPQGPLAVGPVGRCRAEQIEERPRRSSSASGGNRRTRDAASSMASGRPSRRIQIFTMARALAGRQLEAGADRPRTRTKRAHRLGGMSAAGSPSAARPAAAAAAPATPAPRRCAAARGSSR